MKRILIAAILLLSVAVGSQAQVPLRTFTAAVNVSQLPTPAAAFAAAGRTPWFVRDGMSTTDCTVGGGTTVVGCYSNGSAWLNMPGGGGTIGGSIDDGQVAVGSGMNQVAGSDNFSWNGTTLSLAITSTSPVGGIESVFTSTYNGGGNAFSTGVFGSAETADGSTNNPGILAGVTGGAIARGSGSFARLTGVHGQFDTRDGAAGHIGVGSNFYGSTPGISALTEMTTFDEVVGFYQDDLCHDDGSGMTACDKATNVYAIHLAAQTHGAKAILVDGGLSQFSYTTQTPTTVAALPTAAAGNKGWQITVSDSTAVSAEGQACVGSSTHTAFAFSDGVGWKCF